jgi:hypothetical protein
LEASLEMSRRLDDADGAAWSLTLLAFWAAMLGAQPERALSYAKQGLEHAREVGIDLLEADAKLVTAMTDPALDADGRLALYEECASIFDRVGDFDNEANAHRGIGDLARARRDWPEAMRRYKTSVELSKRAGCHGCTAISELGVAGLALGGGDLQAATELCRGPLRHFGRTREVLLLSIALGTAARIVNEGGDPAAGASLLGACDALIRPSGFWSVAEERLGRLAARVRPNIDDDSFDAAFATGTSMSGDDAVAFALDVLDRV